MRELVAILALTTACQHREPPPPLTCHEFMDRPIGGPDNHDVLQACAAHFRPGCAAALRGVDKVAVGVSNAVIATCRRDYPELPASSSTLKFLEAADEPAGPDRWAVAGAIELALRPPAAVVEITADQITVGDAAFPVSAAPTDAELAGIVAAIVRDGGEGGAIIRGSERALAIADALGRALHARSVDVVSCRADGRNCPR